ncbi:hypothetical protein QTJ16_006964 [Diplocarpon rosae]|uniref:Rhodopsin domain-containing protein n=1 Tax=Diplocarpon rosae TaxID=946125 RepID=A0AAD9SSC5_9HELO|nr:hypothetical protein QTJ16_006964 [Diplocarpon rosae]
MASNDLSASESRVPGVLAGSIVPTIIGSAFVVARLYTRKFHLSTWGADDTLISISWLVSIGLAVINGMSVVYGSGRRQVFQSVSEMIATMKLAFVSRVVYQFVLCTMKLGICFFYLRVFQDRTSKITVYIMLGFILVSALATEFTTIFSCKPVSGAWKSGEQNCLPAAPNYIANTACNVGGDLALMIFVIPRIVPLQISRRQKICLLSVVSLGILIIVAAIAKLIAILKLNNNNDLAWDVANIISWTSIEVNTGLLCASAPCIKPLLHKTFPSLLITLSAPSPSCVQHSPETGDNKTARSLHSRKSVMIPHLKKAFHSKTMTGLEEVKLKTIKAKKYDKGTFAYAIRKRDEAFDHEANMMDQSGSESVERWLGRIVDEESVITAAVSAALSWGGHSGPAERSENIPSVSLSSG